MLNCSSCIVVNNVAVLFGRGGQHGPQSVHRKNLLPLLGRPVMAYPLMAARHAQAVDRVYVSTDDEEIALIGRQLGAEIIDRPLHLATKDALIEDAISHAYEEITRCLGYAPEYLTVLMCNAPNILADVIDAGIELLEQNPQFDSVITASKLNMFGPPRARRLQIDGTLKPYVSIDLFGDLQSMSSNRDSAPDAYFGDSGMTIVRGRCLLDMAHNLLPYRWMGKEIAVITQQPGGGDIDAYWQVPVLEFWLRVHGFTEAQTPYDR